MSSLAKYVMKGVLPMSSRQLGHIICGTFPNVSRFLHCSLLCETPNVRVSQDYDPGNDALITPRSPDIL